MRRRWTPRRTTRKSSPEGDRRITSDSTPTRPGWASVTSSTRLLRAAASSSASAFHAGPPTSRIMTMPGNITCSRSGTTGMTLRVLAMRGNVRMVSPWRNPATSPARAASNFSREAHVEAALQPGHAAALVALDQPEANVLRILRRRPLRVERRLVAERIQRPTGHLRREGPRGGVPGVAVVLGDGPDLPVEGRQLVGLARPLRLAHVDGQRRA